MNQKKSKLTVNQACKLLDALVDYYTDQGIDIIKAFGMAWTHAEDALDNPIIPAVSADYDSMDIAF